MPAPPTAAHRVRPINPDGEAARLRIWAARCAGPGYALALTLTVLAPLLAPGYLLLRDAVSTPRSYLSDAALGLGESAPRSVPQDFAVAVGSQLIDGGVLVKALLLAALWLAGCGAARLAATVFPDAGLPGQFVAITVAIWNPYVAERLLQGHWSLLVGYGCLPWVAVAMLALRSADRGDRTPLFVLVFWMALAGLTPTGLLLATTVALACALGPGTGWPRRLCAATALGIGVAAALPWLTALLLGSSSAQGETTGVAAFAARAEPGLGTLGSLAGLGGIWNADDAPASRATMFALVATVALLIVVVGGLAVASRRAAALPLLVLAAVTVLVCAGLATDRGQTVLRTLVDTAPGLGVLRDGQKWVALAMPGYALAGAGVVAGLRRWLRPDVVALACCIALIAPLPDLAWGVGGRVKSVHYPAGWPTVATAINADPLTVAVLPANSMRRFTWAGPAPVLDPLPRWVRADVLSTGDLTVSGHTVPGEGTRARAVQRSLLTGPAPADLVRTGVGWVVIEAGTNGETGFADRTLAQFPVAYRDGDLTLYRIGADSPGISAWRRWVALIAHGLWLTLLVAALAMWLGGLAFTSGRQLWQQHRPRWLRRKRRRAARRARSAAGDTEPAGARRRRRKQRAAEDPAADDSAADDTEPEAPDDALLEPLDDGWD